jgi:hypothetical protein
MMHATTLYVIRSLRGLWRCGLLPGGEVLSFALANERGQLTR